MPSLSRPHVQAIPLVTPVLRLAIGHSEGDDNCSPATTTTFPLCKNFCQFGGPVYTGTIGIFELGWNKKSRGSILITHL